MSQSKIVVPKRRIIVPRMIIRERRAPPPKFGVQLRPQHMRYEVGRYRERLRSGPGGLGRGRIWTPEQIGEQHNLVLDAIGDLIAAYGLQPALMDQAVVGTGSTAPSASDIALASEVAATTAKPSGWSDQISRPADGVYKFTLEREFASSLVGNQNLTEWGFRPGPGQNLAVRELFRDSTGNPITLTLASDQSLRLIYAYQVTLSPLSQSITFDIANIGTVSATMMLHGYHNGDLDALDSWAKGTDAAIVWWDSAVTVPAYNDYFPWGGTNQMNVLTSGPSDTQPWFDSYTLGTRTRSPYLRFGTTAANGAIYGIGLVSKAGYYTGIFFVFDTGSEIAKDNLHRLVIDDWRLTW